MTQRPIRLSADWVYPIDAAPLREAAVLIGAEGRISAIGPADSIPLSADAEAIHLPGAALLPGLVNTHTHLELTGFSESAPEDRFREWILTIRRLKEARTSSDFLEAARAGVRECWAGGVTTVADTGDSGAVIQALSECGGSGIAYHEVFGPHPSQVEESLAGLVSRVGQLTRLTGPRVRLGVSPHAPYTVSGPLYQGVAQWARAEGLPMAVHVAESPEETDFVTRNAGPFAEGWNARGIPLLNDPSHHPSGSHPSSPLQWLDSRGVLGADTLCIHAIQLSAADIDLLVTRGCAVSHCPRSNLRHHHRTAPVAALRRAGIRVGLGTDSVASVGHLDLFAEMLEAQRATGLTDEETLRLATLDGARALGLEGEIGSLTPGKWGDVIAIALPALPGVPPTALLPPRRFAVLLTVLAGRVVHRT